MISAGYSSCASLRPATSYLVTLLAREGVFHSASVADYEVKSGKVSRGLLSRKKLRLS